MNLNRLTERSQEALREAQGLYLLAWSKQPTIAATSDGREAVQTGLTLFATVKPDSRVARARERGLLPPAGAFTALAALTGARAA
jgi:hypothetical protein